MFSTESEISVSESISSSSSFFSAISFFVVSFSRSGVLGADEQPPLDSLQVHPRFQAQWAKDIPQVYKNIPLGRARDGLNCPTVMSFNDLYQHYEYGTASPQEFLATEGGKFNQKEWFYIFGDPKVSVEIMTLLLSIRIYHHVRIAHQTFLLDLNFPFGPSSSST